jgi:hypothetical protein
MQAHDQYFLLCLKAPLWLSLQLWMSGSCLPRLFMLSARPLGACQRVPSSQILDSAHICPLPQSYGLTHQNKRNTQNHSECLNVPYKVLHVQKTNVCNVDCFMVTKCRKNSETHWACTALALWFALLSIATIGFRGQVQAGLEVALCPVKFAKQSMIAVSRQ